MHVLKLSARMIFTHARMSMVLCYGLIVVKLAHVRQRTTGGKDLSMPSRRLKADDSREELNELCNYLKQTARSYLGKK